MKQRQKQMQKIEHRIQLILKWIGSNSNVFFEWAENRGCSIIIGGLSHTRRCRNRTRTIRNAIAITLMKSADVAYIDVCAWIRIGKNVEAGKMMNWQKKQQTTKLASKNGHSKSRQRGPIVANGRHICFLWISWSWYTVPNRRVILTIYEFNSQHWNSFSVLCFCAKSKQI